MDKFKLFNRVFYGIMTCKYVKNDEKNLFLLICIFNMCRTNSIIQKEGGSTSQM